MSEKNRTPMGRAILVTLFAVIALLLLVSGVSLLAAGEVAPGLVEVAVGLAFAWGARRQWRLGNTEVDV